VDASALALRSHAHVGGARDPLVDEARRCVHGDDRHPQPDGGHGATYRAAPVGGLGTALAHLALRGILEPGKAVGLEHGIQCVGDPEFLEGPRHEERGDPGVFVSGGHE